MTNEHTYFKSYGLFTLFLKTGGLTGLLRSIRVYNDIRLSLASAQPYTR